MRWRTEDLLSWCDGEPLDGATRRRLEDSPEAQAEVRRLAKLRATLRTLPGLEPPASAWGRIEAGLERAHRNRRGRTTRSVTGLAAGVLVAAVAIAFVMSRSEIAPPDVPTVSTPRTPVPTKMRGADDDYAALVAESARLERVLMQLPRHRGIRQASTASTIAGLEDQIAWIDAVMSESAAVEADRAYRNALWRERVTIMNALIDVRYAQAPEPIY